MNIFLYPKKSFRTGAPEKGGLTRPCPARHAAQDVLPIGHHAEILSGAERFLLPFFGRVQVLGFGVSRLYLDAKKVKLLVTRQTKAGSPRQFK